MHQHRRACAARTSSRSRPSAACDSASSACSAATSPRNARFTDVAAACAAMIFASSPFNCSASSASPRSTAPRAWDGEKDVAGSAERGSLLPAGAGDGAADAGAASAADAGFNWSQGEAQRGLPELRRSAGSGVDAFSPPGTAPLAAITATTTLLLQHPLPGLALHYTLQVQCIALGAVSAANKPNRGKT